MEESKAAEALLPEDAPRALLSIRLSVLTNETTSPVRQELDLRILARERGCRVVGVASNLNVSATKVPPWRRKQLGDWLNNRSPAESIALYMRELEPGGRYTKTRFTKEQAEATLDKLVGELEAIGPETAKDGWVNIHGGKTLREH
ncbi:hypothetical protein [Streptomyces sp. MAI_2237]